MIKQVNKLQGVYFKDNFRLDKDTENAWSFMENTGFECTVGIEIPEI